SVSFLVCYLLSVRSSQNFDFSVIRKVTGDFDEETPTAEADEADEGDEDRTAVPTGSDRRPTRPPPPERRPPITALLTAYVLMWPVLVLGILITIGRGFVKDVKKAREEGRPVI